ncbi:hypothetical protein Tco_1355766, partial [Tanacetum coccineum]
DSEDDDSYTSRPEFESFHVDYPDSGNSTMDVVEDIFPTREPRVHVPNVLPTHPTLHQDLDFLLFRYPDFEDSRARGFVHSFELHILSFI